MATERLEKAAKLIGTETNEAKIAERLVEAGYGEAFAAGHAKTFRGLLAKEGLLKGAAPKAAPTPAREV